MPGTVARKGVATEERPYRMARLLLSDGEIAAMRVTESMLAQIADMNALDEINLAPPPRELVDPTVCVAMTAERLKSLLVSISSDVPRGNGSIDLVGTTDYWLGVVWAIAGLGLDEGKTIARDWSATSSRYSEEDFETAWTRSTLVIRTPLVLAQCSNLPKL